MRSFKVLAMLLIIGALVGKMYAQGTITIVTEKVVGQTITLLISTEQGTVPVVKGATTNIFKNGMSLNLKIFSLFMSYPIS